MRKIHKVAIVLMCGAAIILGGILLRGVLFNTVQQGAVQQYESGQRSFAKAVANDINEFFVNVEDQLNTIALFPAVKNAVRGEQCNKDLQSVLEANAELFSNLGRINAEGVFICSVNRAVIGEPASKYGTYFQQVKDDPEHKAVMSRLITPTGSGESVIAVHVPTFDDKGVFTGTIGGAVYFSEFQKHLLQDVKVSEGSFIVLHDDNGDTLYHPDPLLRSKNITSPEMLRNFESTDVIRQFAKDLKTSSHRGRLQYRTAAGQEGISMYESAPVIGRSWTASVAVPRVDQEKAIHNKKAEAMVTGIIVTLCAAVFVSIYVLINKNTKMSVKK